MSPTTLQPRTNFNTSEELSLPFDSFTAILRHMLQSPRTQYDAFVTREVRLKNDEFVQHVIGLATALKRHGGSSKETKSPYYFGINPSFL